MGSPAYLAPEQLEGVHGDARADVYAIGLILWETVTGRRPFVGDTASATALARLTRDVPAIGPEYDVDDSLREAIDCATRRDPDERFAAAIDIADALRPLLGDRRPERITGPLFEAP
jgi:eukaryotic-like serine/threonine-protein kinase